MTENKPKSKKVKRVGLIVFELSVQPSFFVRRNRAYLFILAERKGIYWRQLRIIDSGVRRICVFFYEQWLSALPPLPDRIFMGKIAHRKKRPAVYRKSEIK